MMSYLVVVGVIGVEQGRQLFGSLFFLWREVKITFIFKKVQCYFQTEREVTVVDLNGLEI